MAGLVTLELTNNKLTGLPDSMQGLSHLGRIDNVAIKL